MGSNYLSGEFLASPPAWAAGNVQSGFSCTNAGNLYVCAFDNILASTIAPTHTSYSSVPVGVDGVHWLYMGPAPTPRANQGDTPTYSVATVPAQCTQRVDPNPVAYPANAIDYNSFFLSGSDYAPVVPQPRAMGAE